MSFEFVQAFLQSSGIDGWLVYDFRGNNPVVAQLWPGQRWTTRRVAVWIPSVGEPALLVHRIDAPQFGAISGVRKIVYLTWQDWQAGLKSLVAATKGVAMEYSPMGDLPAVSIADAGTVEFVRSLGPEVVSSADVMQLCVARWSPEIRAAHDKASELVNAIKNEAFDLIRQKLRGGESIDEFAVQQFIMNRFADEKLDPGHPPIVAVNANSADPHFEPTAANTSRIRRGDWILIDLWARWPGEEHVFSDITWVAYAGESVPTEHRRAFEAVRSARDASLKLAQDAWRTKTPVRGYQLDDAARNVLVAAGFDRNVVHRTGHSLSPGPKIHGLGVNLDNFETRDNRLLLDGLGFTIEPAIYFPENFGCRLEINAFVDDRDGVVVTSDVQKDVILV
jgi:Xaa-Pro dipeptidase